VNDKELNEQRAKMRKVRWEEVLNSVDVSEDMSSGAIVRLEGYKNIKECAEELGLSVYRVRQLYWNKEFTECKKVGKLIFISNKDVTRVKEEREKKKEGSKELDRERMMKRIQKSAEVMLEVVKGIKSLKGDEKRVIVEFLSMFGGEQE